MREVAIVGRSCVLPGALNPSTLWDLSIQGDVLFEPCRSRYWRSSIEVICKGQGLKKENMLGSYVHGFDTLYDHEVFSMPKKFAGASLDPLFKWVLYTAWESLKEAGGDREDDKKNCALILGNLSLPSSSFSSFCEQFWLCQNGFDHAQLEKLRHKELGSYDGFSAGLPALLAKVSLALGGPAFGLDAAGASSLFAIKLACDLINNGQTKLALVGAVQHSDDMYLHMGLSQLGTLSKQGFCRPFQADTDGTIPAEGAGFVCLMDLEEAEKRACHIYGLIKGIGSCHDGYSPGILVPKVQGQVRAINDAFEQAGCSPDQVSYVECHAAGTLEGDASEIQSLKQAFLPREHPLFLGAIKGNLGNLFSASGIASLIRITEAFKHQQIPPTPYTQNPMIQFEGSPFELLGKPRPWQADHSRVAGLSEFAMGGNNAHLILGEYRKRKRGGGHQVKHSLPINSSRAEAIAVVAVKMKAGAFDQADGLIRALFEQNLTPNHYDLKTCRLWLSKFKNPTHGLETALGQHLLALELCMEARECIPKLNLEKTGLVVGMGLDPQICRFGFSLRLEEWSDLLSQDEDWLQYAKSKTAAELSQDGVLGSLPHMVANRVSKEEGFGGASFTVGAEEHSGGVALDIAIEQLRQGAWDAAFVAAVDFASDPIRSKPLETLRDLHGFEAGDGGAVLVLKRFTDAIADGDQVHAVFGMDLGQHSDCIDYAPDPKLGFSMSQQFGHAPAAASLIHVAGAVMSLHYKLKPGGDAWPLCHPKHLRACRVSVENALGEAWTCTLTEDPATTKLEAPALPEASNVDPIGEFLEVPYHKPGIHLPPLLQPKEGQAPRPTSDDEPIDKKSQGKQIPWSFDEKKDLTMQGAFTFRKRILQAHKTYLSEQKKTHQYFLEYRKKSLDALYQVIPKQVLVENGLNLEQTFVKQTLVNSSTNNTKPEDVPPIIQEIELRLDREAVKKLYLGRTDEVFGPEFKSQSTQSSLSMPKLPCRLVDEVLALKAVPRSLGKGQIKTRTLVDGKASNINEKHMLAGTQLELGRQGLLFLLSFLGIDTIKQGEIALHLLACELSFPSSLPKAGDTLIAEIGIDSPVQQKKSGLFTFHYDCFVDGHLVLSLKNGKACVFASQESWHESSKSFWSADRHIPCKNPKLEYHKAVCIQTTFDESQIKAFAHGDSFKCFGPGFEKSVSHYHSPRIASEKMCLIQRVVQCEREGGPWKRGYLKAQSSLGPGASMYAEMIRNNGSTLDGVLLEASLQSLAFYLAYLGFTLERDAWRFEPVKGHEFSLTWYGSLGLDPKLIEYEVFVEELIADPMPQVKAYVLGKVDGRSAFIAKGIALELVPDFSLLPSLSPKLTDDLSQKEFPFDPHSLVACAIGSPASAYPVYQTFPEHRRMPRLPAPPYLFCTQVRSFQGEWGRLQEGAELEMEYHFDGSEWYFAHRTKMPFNAMIEVALQPCYWLSSALGAAITSDEELFSRNLNGRAVLNAEVEAEPGCIVTRVRLTKVSKVASMLVQSFEVSCFLEGHSMAFFMLNTDLGYLSKSALENQVGFLTDAREHDYSNLEPQCHINLAAGSEAHMQGPLSLQADQLLMVDQIVYCDFDGGSQGLGFLVAEKNIKPDEWFFRSHFFGDPVMPGSLMVEAVLQLLRLYCIEKGFARSACKPEWEVLCLGQEIAWKLRGQILPTHKKITYSLTIEELKLEPEQLVLVADASILVDGIKIAAMHGLSIRIKADGPIQEEHFTPNLPLSRHFDSESRLSKELIEKINANPYTVKEKFGSYNPKEVLFKEYVAHKEGVCPIRVPESFPFNHFPVSFGEDQEDLILTPKAGESLDISSCLDYWSQCWGLSTWLGADLLSGILHRFVHSVYLEDPQALLGIKNEAIVFVSNQQVSVEIPIFSHLMSSFLQKTVKNLVRQEFLPPWLEDLRGLLGSCPEVSFLEQTHNIAPRHRGDKHTPFIEPILKGIENKLALNLPALRVGHLANKGCMTKAAQSLLASDFSKSFYLVPVGFLGALPLKPLDKKLGFPYAMSQQKIVVGKPIASHDLIAWSPQDKEDLLTETFGSLNPSGDRDELLAVDEQFGRLVHSWMLSSRVKVEQAVLFCTLREMLEKGMKVSSQTQRLVEAQHNGVLQPLDDPKIHAWLERVTRWFLGRKYLA
ncbi:MAG: hypothetical protein HRU09_08595 [Oligoflexales bacterium]|nr:hypothetical protein [Oligoflexales bacterium]